MEFIFYWIRMATFVSVIVIVLIFSVAITAQGHHVKIESMQKFHTMRKLHRPPSDTEHNVIFAIKQSNLSKLEDLIIQLSTPGHLKYQQWLTFEEVGEITQNVIASEAVMEWLKSNSIEIISTTPYRTYITAKTTIGHWESLLQTTFYEWESDHLSNSMQIGDQTWKRSKPKILRSEDFSLPVELAHHVSTVFYTCQALPQISHFAVPKTSEMMTAENKYVSKTTVVMQHESDSYDLRGSKYFKLQPNRRVLQTTAGTVTISFLDTYYYIPQKQMGTAAQNQSCFETSNQFYSQSDVTQFQQKYGTMNQAVIQENVAVSNQQTSSCSTASRKGPDCQEANLDLQYIMGISQKTATIFWYVNSGDSFVGWITEVAASTNPPKSNSISWGSVEQTVSESVLLSFSTEAMKLGVQGVTITVSSGDDGVAGSGCNSVSTLPVSSSNGACNAPSGSSTLSWKLNNTWVGQGYFPSFPATCPYVTAVGATMGVHNVVPNLGEKERSCQSKLGGVVESGGGFSTYYPRPAWQQSQVANYFSVASPQPVQGYNPHGRGIPDVSLLGVSYEIIVGGQLSYIYGTSASAPVFAGFVSLINAMRHNQSKPTIGFMNPTLYAASSSKKYNDITSGSNYCCHYSGYSFNAESQTTCCQSGFVTATGWDPVTGLGSIYLPQFAGLFGESIPFQLQNYTNTSDSSWFQLTETVIIIIAVIGAIVLFFIGGILCRYVPIYCERSGCKQTRSEPFNQPAARRRSNPGGPQSTPRRASSNPATPAHAEPSYASEEQRIIAMQALAWDQQQQQHHSRTNSEALNQMIGSAPDVVSSRPPTESNRGSDGIDYGNMEFWPLWEAETKQLAEMGFTDKNAILPLLKLHMVVPVSMTPDAPQPDAARLRRVIDDLVSGAK